MTNGVDSMRFKYVLLFLVVLAAQTFAVTRNLIIVNSLGETADYAKLTENNISQNVATLGLAPNDFVVVGNTGVAVNSTSNDLYFFSLPEMHLLGTVYLGSSRNPYAGTVIDSNHLLITNLVSSTLTKINISRRNVDGEYPVGKSPEGAIVVGQRAYVCITNFDLNNYTYGQGLVQVFDLNNNTVTKSTPVGTNPQDIALGYDNYLYVICTGNYSDQHGILYKLSLTEAYIIDSLPIGGSPTGLAITRSGLLFLSGGGWVGYGEVYTVDLNSFQVIRGTTNPIHTGLGVTSVVAVSDSTVVSCNFSDDSITELTPSGHVLTTLRTGDGPLTAAKYPSCFVKRGDADGSGAIDISDAVYMINRIFSGGAPPVVTAAGDFNCDNGFDISDAVAIISHIFSGGAGSCGCAD